MTIDDDILDIRIRRFLDVRAEELAHAAGPSAGMATTVVARSGRSGRQSAFVVLGAAALIALMALAAVVIAGAPHRPTTLGSWTMPRSVAWSPDGSRLAFMALAPESGTSSRVAAKDLYVVDADGSGLRRLASWPIREAIDAEVTPGLLWAPDGHHVALPVHAAADSSAVAIVGLDGSDPVIVASTDASSPIGWAPVGDRLLIALSGSWGNDLESVGPDGSDLIRLTTDHRASGGIWSPDGSKILYVDGVVGGTQEGDSATWVMDADGTHKSRLGMCCDAGWSSDGRSAYLDSDGAALIAVPVDGGPSRKLADIASVTGWLLGPDGSTLAVVDENGITMRRSDGTSSRLTTDGRDALVAWSPDGKYIAFLGNRSAGAGMFTIPVAGGSPTMVAANASTSKDVWRPGSGTDRVVFGRDGALITADVDGSAATPVVVPERTSDMADATPKDRMIIGPNGPDRPVYRIPLSDRYVFTIENRTDHRWLVTFPAIDLWQSGCHVASTDRIGLVAFVEPAATAPPLPAAPPDACIVEPHETVSVDQPYVAPSVSDLGVYQLQPDGTPGLPSYVVIVDAASPSGSSVPSPHEARESASP